MEGQDLETHLVELDLGTADSLHVSRQCQPRAGWETMAPPLDLDYDQLPTPTSIRLLIPRKHRVWAPTHPPLSGEVSWSYTLTIVDLENCPHYVALSYTWGDPCTTYQSRDDLFPSAAWMARTYDIEVNERLLSVTPNLYSALLAQGPDSPPLWADAVCINQPDLDERAAQVRLMSRIYRDATETAIWLGAFDSTFFQTMDAAVSLGKIDEKHYPDLRSMSILDEASYRQLSMPVVSVEAWLGIYLFLSRSWFKRIWVLQELALSRRPIIFTGTVNFTFDVLVELCAMLQFTGWWNQVERLVEPLIDTGRRGTDRVSDDMRARYPWIRLHRSLVSTSTDRSCLDALFITYTTTPPRVESGKMLRYSAEVALLDRHRHSEATDMRDKVYALLGVFALYPNSNVRDFPIDYSSTAQEVYTAVTRHIIETSQTLSILSIKEPDPYLAGLPSWVPDFSAAADLGSARERFLRQQASGEFRRGTATHPRHSSRAGPQELAVSAISLGTVSMVLNLIPMPEAGGLVRFVRYCVEELEAWPRSVARTHRNCLRTIIAATTRQDGTPPEEVMGFIGDTIAADISVKIIRAAATVRRFRLRHAGPNYVTFDHGSIEAELGDLEVLRDWSGEIRDEGVPSRKGGRRSNNTGSLQLPSPFDDIHVDFGSYETERDLYDEESRLLSEIHAMGLDIREVRYRSLQWKGDMSKVCVTRHGHIGNVPGRVKAGDVACILAGADMPLVLRPLAQRRYSLVALSNMPGLMDGEAVTQESMARATDIFLL